MSADLVLHQLLLVLAAAALAAAGVRLASVLADDGLERVLAAFTFAAAGAVVEAIVLGLAGLGGDTTALTLAAAATFAVARVSLPRPSVGPAAELLAWLRGSATPTWLGVGGALGVVVAWIAWQLRHPLIEQAALLYHLPIASAFVQSGRPGSVVNVLPGAPFGNYPVTNEVIVGWALGISRSWVAISIWSPVLLTAVAAGGWVALREWGAGRAERVLAVVAVCIPPVMIVELSAPFTDVAALAWLAVAAALATASRRRPGLIYSAILAAALGFGTKTTTTILLVALACVAARPLRRMRRHWLLPTLGVAVVLGGLWPLRNLIEHGSPLWPLLSTPWGDPVPAAFRGLDARFLDHPRHLLGAYWRDYLGLLGGGAVLIGGGLVLPLVRRSRPALAAAGVAALALLAWGLAPYTGVDTKTLAVANTRYMQPAIAVCAIALALCARGSGRGFRLTVLGLFGASIAYSVQKTASFGPTRPSLATLGLGAGAGLLVAALLRRPPVAFDRRVVVGALGVACVLGLAAGGSGYIERYVTTNDPPDRALYAWPALGRGTTPIASTVGAPVLLRGDRLQHPLVLLGDRASCRALQTRLRRGPVVLPARPSTPADRRLAECVRGATPGLVDPYFAVYG